MSARKPTTIRLSAEKRLLYQAEATRQGMELSSYLREWLEKNEPYLPNSQNLQSTLKSSDSSFPYEEGVLLEILLILRCIVAPEKRNLVRSELKRLNISVWQADNSSEKTNNAT